MKLHILQALHRAAPSGLSVTTLRTELELVLRRRPGEVELANTLSEMQDDGLAHWQDDDLTGDRVWQLTPAGTARVKAH